jgi:hypothetical protein
MQITLVNQHIIMRWCVHTLAHSPEPLNLVLLFAGCKFGIPFPVLARASFGIVVGRAQVWASTLQYHHRS